MVDCNDCHYGKKSAISNLSICSRIDKVAKTIIYHIISKNTAHVKTGSYKCFVGKLEWELIEEIEGERTD